jgi:hypothetical protein
VGYIFIPMALFRLICLIAILHSSSALSTSSRIKDRSCLFDDGGRRKVIFGLASFPSVFGFRRLAWADDEATVPPFQLNVLVTIPSTVDKEHLLGTDTALFVTARPVIISEDQIPPELVMKYAKVPPVLTKKVIFPKDFRVTLGMEDATPEGMQWKGWEKLPLTVSARLDADGIASTRNSTDLVGRISPVAPGTLGTVPLQGRGFVGKLLQ